MIYTSYFANTKCKNIDCVAISRTQPKGTSFRYISELCPSSRTLWDYKAGKISWESYVKEYNNQLQSLEKRLLTWAKQYDNNKDIVLLCWEKDPTKCHRTLVREFLNSHGIPCEEL